VVAPDVISVASPGEYPFTECMAMECEGWDVQPSALHPHSWPNKGDALGRGAVHVFVGSRYSGPAGSGNYGTRDGDASEVIFSFF
jgi:hypothetical protein